jgi:hypothetical protein
MREIQNPQMFETEPESPQQTTLVLMYRKLSLSIIDNFAIFGLSNYRFFLRKLSITIIIENTGISSNSNFFLIQYL